MKESERKLWDNDPYNVPDDKKYLTQNRERDKEKFGKLVPKRPGTPKKPDPKA